jgi:hypothetical protein
MGGSLGDAEPVSDVAQPNAWIRGNAEQREPVVG